MLPTHQDNVQLTPLTYLTTELANERTFLAWIRTSLGIMAFGFVVERFSLFVKQIAFLLSQSPLSPSTPPSEISGYSSFLGIFLVGLGSLMGFLSFIKYKRTEKQIKEGRYQQSLLLETLLTLSIMVIGILLIFYLIHSI